MGSCSRPTCRTARFPEQGVGAESGMAVRRTFWLSVVLPLLMGLVGTVLAQTLMLPDLVAAQVTRFRGDEVTVIGDNGADRIRQRTGPGARAEFQILAPDGATPRVSVQTGGPTGTRPGGAGLNLYALDGSDLARLGTY